MGCRVQAKIMAEAGEQQSKPDARLYLSVLEGFSLTAGNARLQMSSVKARAMFAHLALSANMEQSRERLAGLLWGDSPERKARASLRGALLAVREALGSYAETALHADNQSLSIMPDALQVDILEIGNSLRAGDVPEQLLRQQGLCDRILANLSIGDEAFNEWLTVYRQTTQENWLRSLRDIMRTGPGTERMADAARAILNLEPLHEEACRYLMEHAAARSDTAGALKLYNQLYTALGDDYDMEPAVETQHLVERIKLGDIPPARPEVPAPPKVAPLIGRNGSVTRPLEPRVTASPATSHAAVGSPGSGQKPIVTILVGDFVADAVSNAQKYLVTGFKGDLITGLVRFRDWVIMGSAPAMVTPNFGPNDPIYQL